MTSNLSSTAAAPSPDMDGPLRPAPRPRREALARTFRIAAVLVAAVPFLLSVDAQWLKLDDFSMIELFRREPLSRLLPDILLTRTTPHVRFAFLHHILLLPLLRGGYSSRSIVNAYYLLSVAALLLSSVALVRPLRRSAVAWAAGWLVLVAAIVSTNTWNTLEFKTATYLVFGFAGLAALAALTWRMLVLSAEGARRRDVVAWVALAIASAHMAEVTLFGTMLLAAALLVARRAPVVPVAAACAWPLVYWLAMLATTDRGMVVVGGGNFLGMFAAVPGALRVSWALARAETIAVLACGAAFLVLSIQAARARSCAVLGQALFVVALPISGAALAVMTEVHSPGYTVERYVMYGQLCAAAGVACALTVLAAGSKRAASLFLTVCVLAASLYVIRERMPRFWAYVDARREEIVASLALQASVRRQATNAAAEGREVVVFVRDWRLNSATGEGLDASFLSYPWARESFARTLACDAPCPRITFVPNAGWLRVPFSAEDRARLCERVVNADVLDLVDARVAPSLRKDAPTDLASCERWLLAERLVYTDEKPKESP